MFRLSYYIVEFLIFMTNHGINKIPIHFIRLFWYRRIMKYRIGHHSSILLGCRMDTRRQLIIGESSTINENCRLDNRGTLTIGNRVSISAETIILTADHDIQNPQFQGRIKPVVVGDYAFIGTRAMILPGVTLGKGAVAAAGSVVTRDVDDYTIVAGIPAKPIGKRNEDLSYRPEYRRFFH